MNKIIRIIIIILFLFILFGLDFLRDFVFKNLDLQMFYVNHLDENGNSSVINYTHSFMEKLLNGYSDYQIYYLKWGFTILFTAVFFSVGSIFLKFLYPKKAVLFFLYLYLTLFVLASIIYSINFITYNMTSYLISLEIMHFLQSSIATLFMILAFKIYQKSQAIR